MNGSLHEKNGIYWTAIYLGKDHSPKYDWKSTKLPAKGNKKAAEKMLRERVAEWEARLALNESELTFADFMLEWVDVRPV